jgi:WD40 repeat protein
LIIPELWDCPNGGLYSNSTNQVDQVWRTYSPDGKVLASGSMDGIIASGIPTRAESFQTLTGHTGQVSIDCFSPDGQFLLNGFVDGTCEPLDVKTGGATKPIRFIKASYGRWLFIGWTELF